MMIICKCNPHFQSIPATISGRVFVNKPPNQRILGINNPIELAEPTLVTLTIENTTGNPVNFNIYKTDMTWTLLYTLDAVQGLREEHVLDPGFYRMEVYGPGGGKFTAEW